MYTKDFEIRWSDTDANRHLSNSAYLNFMSHTRTAFLNEHGFSLTTLGKAGIGAVVFSEQIYYFKESFLSEIISVSMEVVGLSKDGMLFKFEHNFYNKKGEHLATCDISGAWINLHTRKLTGLPEDLLNKIESFPKSENFEILTKANSRSNKRPKNLSI